MTALWYNVDMNEQEIITVLKPIFRIYNVRKAVLFGSFAKGTADASSDVDIFVDSGLKGMKFVGFVEDLRRALGDREIDVIDSTHVDGGAKVLDEVNKTGVVMYER